jgi:hypothetical protein
VKGACEQGIRSTGGGQSCWWWSQGCSIGCKQCATELIGPDGAAGGNSPHTDKIGFRKRFCNSSYNSAGAPVPLINSTLPREAWTMNVHAVEGTPEDRCALHVVASAQRALSACAHAATDSIPGGLPVTLL